MPDLQTVNQSNTNFQALKNKWQSNKVFFQLDFSENSQLMGSEMGSMVINKEK